METIEVSSLCEVVNDLNKRGIKGEAQIRAVNEYLNLKARQKAVPAAGMFELTPLCNLDCKMCYVHLSPVQMGPGNQLLTTDEWKHIISQAVDAGMIYAVLTGGECLTYPGFKEVYLHLFSLGVKPTIMTNGVLLTQDMIAFLVKYPPDMIQITLYGSNEDAYECVTGHRAYAQVISGIQRAREAGLDVRLSMTPSRYMQEDALMLLERLHELDLPYVIGDATIPARNETQRDMEEYAVELDAYMQIKHAERVYEMSGKQRRYVSIPRYLPRDIKKQPGLPCGGANSSFHVNWKGELCPCVAFSHSVKCSVLDHGFESAWKNIRQTMVQYRPPEECAACVRKDTCFACPGEVSGCEITGKLNKAVCRRLERLEAERFGISKETDNQFI